MTDAQQIRILYLCSSQFSGTTLTSFLLNNHSAVATIGHTMGWRYENNEDFRCSCGQTIANCPLFQHIRKEFDNNHLIFNPQNFGTAFQLSERKRLNQLFVGPLPLLQSTLLEKLRDRIVAAVPHYRARFEKQQFANYVLMKSVTEYFSSDFYLDNSHSPFRLRLLNRNPNFLISPIHLIRDPRGVVLSLMTNSGFPVNQAIDTWIRHQLNILRITEEVGRPLLLRYEDLCCDTNTELSRIHEYAGIPHEKFSGDFKANPHHILGNRMRLSNGEIRHDERWRQDLRAEDRSKIEKVLNKFCVQNSSHQLSEIISRYLEANAIPDRT